MMDDHDDETRDESRPGIGRRTLIKRAAVAGAAAWTAPVILGSVASPAGALTCTSCFQFQIDGDCSPASTQAVSGLCPIATPAGCTTPTDIAAGRSFASLCFTATDCTGDSVTFTLNATSATCWTPGTCAPNRRFLAAVARINADEGPDFCLNPLTLTNTTVSFAKQDDDDYDFFKFIVGCTCS
jgi:hypothetical protein